MRVRPAVGNDPRDAGPDTAEFNQQINGNAYVEQDMWSNDDSACVQGTSSTATHCRCRRST